MTQAGRWHLYYLRLLLPLSFVKSLLASFAHLYLYSLALLFPSSCAWTSSHQYPVLKDQIDTFNASSSDCSQLQWAVTYARLWHISTAAYYAITLCLSLKMACVSEEQFTIMAPSSQVRDHVTYHQYLELSSSNPSNIVLKRQIRSRWPKGANSKLLRWQRNKLLEIWENLIDNQRRGGACWWENRLNRYS